MFDHLHQYKEIVYRYEVSSISSYSLFSDGDLCGSRLWATGREQFRDSGK
jgi:hypothetical protein